MPAYIYGFVVIEGRRSWFTFSVRRQLFDRHLNFILKYNQNHIIIILTIIPIMVSITLLLQSQTNIAVLLSRIIPESGEIS
jgi:hypothetical protein